MAKKILGPIFGLLFGIFLAIDLIVFGVIAFESVMVTVLPVLGLILGGVLAFTTPLGKTHATATPDAATAATAGHDLSGNDESQADSAAITSDGA